MYYDTRIKLKNAVSNLKMFIYNLLCLAERPPHENDYALTRNLILSMPREEKDKYACECKFIESLPPDLAPSITFPYSVKQENIPGQIDTGTQGGFPYVVHGKDSKLFFPRRISINNALQNYRNLVFREGLLGTGVLEKSPHCYQDQNFKVEDGDILLDIGCSEAIFALDNIAKASKVFLFECERMWQKPLRKTFAPYASKTVIVNKLVADKTTSKHTTLLDVVKGDMSDSSRFFVKMDIEGWERTVIKGNADFFKSAKIKLSCCVYHRQDDAQVIEAMLREMGYTTRFSDGYMLPPINGIHFPYFRRGVIYARNY